MAGEIYCYFAMKRILGPTQGALPIAKRTFLLAVICIFCGSCGGYLRHTAEEIDSDDNVAGRGSVRRTVINAGARTAPKANKDTSLNKEKVFYGIASYYREGPSMAKTTASGEPFSDSDLTAAHRELPFGTRLRVTNLKNGRSVIVKVNDRGPFSERRVLDLSFAAARHLNMVGAGVAKVRVEQES